MEQLMIEEDLNKYCSCMEEIKRRTQAVESILQNHFTTSYPATNIEFMCLQIRKILELIALGSLVANKEEYAKQHLKFAKHWRAKRILDDIEKINPKYYPAPGKQVIDPNTKKVKELIPIKDGFLTRTEFPDVYDRCSKAIHAANPFGNAIDYPSLEKDIPAWMKKIIMLLNHHQIQLLNEKQMLWVLMEAKTDGRVHSYIFERKDDLNH
jgi:hypothetical protein